MDILESHIIMEPTWWYYLSIVFMVGGVFCAFASMAEDLIPAVVVCASIALAGMIVFFFAPAEQPTDRWSTTVEITELEQYKVLVQNGYTFKKVYEDREIYVIEGDEAEYGKG